MESKRDDATTQGTDRTQLHDSTPSIDRLDASAPAAKRSNGPIRYFWDNQRDPMIREAVVAVTVGALLAILAFCLTSWFQDQRFKHQEVLENTRFARELSLTNGKPPLSGLNFREAELSGLTLSGANFARADLTGANLRWTVLTGEAYLAMAVLNDANLTGANLTEANLTEAELTGTNLTGANLTEAELTGTNLTRAYLTASEPTDADPSPADFTGAILIDADLTDANLAGAILIDTDLTNATLTGVRFERHFEEVTISGVCYDSSTVWPEDYEIELEPSCPGELR